MVICTERWYFLARVTLFACQAAARLHFGQMPCQGYLRFENRPHDGCLDLAAVAIRAIISLSMLGRDARKTR